MSSTFSGINIALSSLLGHQAALDVTGQNVANVSTPGYHRQEAVFTPRGAHIPDPLFNNVLAGGVDVTSVMRAEAGFVDVQARLAAANGGTWLAAQQPLGAAQSIIGQPYDQDLGMLLNQFWNAWSGLAASPDEIGARVEVHQAGTSLAEGINRQYSDLGVLRDQTYATLELKVAEINELAAQVAELNAQITSTEALGRSAAALRDQRDVALDRLAALAGVVAPSALSEDSIITLEGHPLIQGSQAFEIGIDLAADGTVQLTWVDDGSALELSAGEVAGLIQVRDQQLVDYMRQLDDIAVALIARVNELHDDGAGMNGEVGPFFTGTGAADIRLSDVVAGDPAAIAAGAAGLPADGSVALAIAGVRDEALVGGLTLGENARGLLAQVGADMQAAQNEASIAGAVSHQLDIQRQSLTGVSLDEELTRMIQYQHAYGAAARLVSTIDAMIGDVIQMVG